MPLRVLIAEDHEYFRSVLREFLVRCECLVVSDAENGQQAIELTELHTPDLVLMDINMPQLNGIDACSALKQQLNDQPVILYTAAAVSEESVLASSQANALLDKQNLFAELPPLLSELGQSLAFPSQDPPSRTSP